MAKRRPLTNKQFDAVVAEALGGRKPGKLTRALTEAVHRRDLGQIDALLAAGADPNKQVDGVPALAYLGWPSSPKQRAKDVVARLLKAGAKATFPGLAAMVPADCVPILVGAGASLDAVAEGGLVAIALADRRPATALALLEAGADPNEPTAEGVAPLLYAVATGEKKVYDALMARGVNVNVVDATGRSPVRIAAEGLAGAALLLPSKMSGVRVMLRELRAMLPTQPEDVIIAAIAFDDADELRRLLASGLSPSTRIRGAIGGIGMGFHQMMGLVPEDSKVAGFPMALPDSATKDQAVGGCSLLSWAVCLRAPRCVESLVEHGADPNAPNDAGISAADLTCKSTEAIRRMLGVKFKPSKSSWITPGMAQATPNLASFRQEEYAKSQVNSRLTRLGGDPSHPDRFGPRVAVEAIAGVVSEPTRGFCDLVWERIASAHVLEQPARIADVIEMFERDVDKFFFAIPSGVSHIDPRLSPAQRKRRWKNPIDADPWVDHWPSALAVARVVGNVSLARRLLDFVSPDLARTYDRDLSYNRAHFEWPVCQQLVRLLGRQILDDTYAKMIREHPSPLGKRARLLLDVIDRLAANDAKAVEKAMKAYLTYHHSPRGDLAGKLPCPYPTIFVLYARESGMDVCQSEWFEDRVVLTAG